MAALNTAGTVLSALPLIDNCIRLFRSVRLATTFTDDYDACLIRLDLACWNLATWHKLRGSQDLNNEECVALLQGIERAFERARSVSAAYATDADAQLEDTRTQQGTSTTATQLHQRIQSQIRGGPKATHIGGKLLWVLYRRQELDDIVKVCTEKIGHLIARFPPGTGKGGLDLERVALVKGIESTDELTLLRRAAKATDEAFRVAAGERLGVRGGHRYSGIVAGGEHFHFGNEYGDPVAMARWVVEGNEYSDIRVHTRTAHFGDKFLAGPEMLG